ncbi:MAG TPA: hypothetical protein VGR71_04295 [Nitrospira sp.]|nr:hypothetical protein [Nitrospira sp.]
MNPTFTDIVKLLNTLSNGNADDAPHGAFWVGVTRDQFVAIQTDNWGVNGPLITLGNPQASNLYLALAGLAPFDGSGLPQMPDTGAAPSSRHASTTELQMVSTWILHNAPA